MIRMILWALAAGVVATALNAPPAEADQMSRTKEVVAHSIADGDPWDPSGTLPDRTEGGIEERLGVPSAACPSRAPSAASLAQPTETQGTVKLSIHRLLWRCLWRVLCLFP